MQNHTMYIDLSNQNMRENKKDSSLMNITENDRRDIESEQSPTLMKYDSSPNNKGKAGSVNSTIEQLRVSVKQQQSDEKVNNLNIRASIDSTTKTPMSMATSSENKRSRHRRTTSHN